VIVTVTVFDPPDDNDPFVGDTFSHAGCVEDTFQFNVSPPALLTVNVFSVLVVPKSSDVGDNDSDGGRLVVVPSGIFDNPLQFGTSSPVFRAK